MGSRKEEQFVKVHQIIDFTVIPQEGLTLDFLNSLIIHKFEHEPTQERREGQGQGKSGAKHAKHIASQYLQGEDDISPCFVTPEEEEVVTSISKMTKDQLCNKVSQLISDVSSDDDKLNFMNQYNKAKKTFQKAPTAQVI